MAKKSAKEVVSEATQKVAEAAKETQAETGAEVSKEGKEAAEATKNFFKEVWDWIKALCKAVGVFFKHLFKKTPEQK